MTQVPYDGRGELHVTDIETARTMDKTPFDSVVTVCQEPIRDNVSSETRYAWFNMSDGESGYGGLSDYWLFEYAVDEVVERLESGECVLVHCHHGKSRSVTVAGTALSMLTGRYYLFEITRVLNARGFGVYPDSKLLNHAHRYWEGNA